MVKRSRDEKVAGIALPAHLDSTQPIGSVRYHNAQGEWEIAAVTGWQREKDTPCTIVSVTAPDGATLLIGKTVSVQAQSLEQALDQLRMGLSDAVSDQVEAACQDEMRTKLETAHDYFLRGEALEGVYDEDLYMQYLWRTGLYDRRRHAACDLHREERGRSVMELSAV